MNLYRGDIQEIQIVNDITKELIGTIEFADEGVGIITEPPYIKYIVYKNKKC
jgi:hypothetical protein